MGRIFPLQNGVGTTNLAALGKFRSLFYNVAAEPYLSSVSIKVISWLLNHGKYRLELKPVVAKTLFSLRLKKQVSKVFLKGQDQQAKDFY